MANIPLPERGQPLDVTYISQMATAINNMSKILPATIKNFSVESSGSVNLNEIFFIAKSKAVVSSGTKTAGEEVAFPIDYNSVIFKSPPIITATLVNTGKSTAGKNTTIVLSDITPSGATGTVRFNATGDVSVVVNLMIMGLK